MPCRRSARRGAAFRGDSSRSAPRQNAFGCGDCIDAPLRTCVMWADRKRTRLFAVLLGLSVVVPGCGGTTASQSAGPTPVKCQPALTGLPGSFAASGARLNATLSTTRDCLWEATTDSAWLQINPSRGQGEAALRVVGGREHSCCQPLGNHFRQRHAGGRQAAGRSVPLHAEHLLGRGVVPRWANRCVRQRTSGCAWTASSAVGVGTRYENQRQGQRHGTVLGGPQQRG